MNDYIAYCGLDCETCEARLATVNNDDALRQRVAKEWSELNSAEITPEMINCSGCRIPGVKTPYCDFLCPIRQCAMSKQMETCGRCPEMIFTTFMRAMIPIQPYSHAGILRTGSSLVRHTTTNTKSATVSSLAPNLLTVSVFLATNPSRISDNPPAM